MDMEQKDMYETYEYLPSGSTETETEQFLVVENNGTFLLNMNKDVKYVTEMQDVKEVFQSVQSCTVYDTTTQQYYVDVENPSELISVTDEFVLSEGENSNIYGNNYLLPSLPEETTENEVQVQVSAKEEPEIIETNDEYDKHIIEQEQNNPMQGKILTEITLSEDQWKMLELKGWILLQINDKIYLLNTTGLHDITDNQKLIEKLKNEIAAFLQYAPASTSNEENVQTKSEFEDMQLEEASVQPVAEEKLPDITNNTASMENCEDEAIIKPTIPSSQEADIPSLPTLLTKPYSNNNLKSLLKQPVKQNAIARVDKAKPKKYNRFLRLETKAKAEDIPAKLVLGKTKGGKKLVARVIGVQTSATRSQSNDPQTPITKNNQPYEMDKLFKEFVAVGSSLKCAEADIGRAATIVRQLLSVPSTRAPLVGAHLLVTMIRKTDVKSKQIEKPVFVTGRVQKSNSSDEELKFVYVPNMLQKMIFTNSVDEEYTMSLAGSAVRLVCSRARDCVVHVHAAETACRNQPNQIDVTLTKKKLPLMAISKGGIPSLHACASCAKCFDSEQELLKHQEGCFENANGDNQENKSQYKTDNRTENKASCANLVTCEHCNVQVKQRNMKRHMQCHFAPRGDGDADQPAEAKDAPYKCKMCPTSYIHSSSLTKHILKQHIEVNRKSE